MKLHLLCLGVLALGASVWGQGFGSPGLIQKEKANPVTPELLHASVVNTFVRSEGLGLSRMPTVHRSTVPELALGEKVYRVKLVQLIGLENNPVPTAYITPGVTPEKFSIRAAMRNKTIQTRPLSAFEKNALEQLAGGQHLALGTNDGVLVMAGSLVATKECLNCHSCQDGKMLGAMSYAFEEVMPPKPVPGQKLLPASSSQVINVSALKVRE